MDVKGFDKLLEIWSKIYKNKNNMHNKTQKLVIIFSALLYFGVESLLFQT